MNHYQLFLQKMAKKDWHYIKSDKEAYNEANKLPAKNEPTNRYKRRGSQNDAAIKKIEQQTRQTNKTKEHHATKAKKYQEGYKTNLAKADINEEAARQHGNAIKNQNQPQPTNQNTPKFKPKKINFDKDK